VGTRHTMQQHDRELNRRLVWCRTARMVRRPHRRRTATEPWLAFGTPAGRPWTPRQLGLLALVALVATVARLFRVEIWPFTADEVVTWRGVTAEDAASFASLDAVLSGHPLVVWTMRWLLDSGVLSARGEGWLRLPFVFVGITAVPLLAVATKKLVGSAWVALFAALLLAVHPWHVATSQSASSVGFVTTFALAAVAALPTEAPSWWRSLVAALSALAAMATHPAGFLVLPMLAARLVGRRDHAPPVWLAAVRIAAVVVAVVLPAIVLRWSDPSLCPVVTSGAAWLRLVSRGGWLVISFAAVALVAVRPLPAIAASTALLPLASLGIAAATGSPIGSDDFLPLLPAIVALAALIGTRAFVVVREGGVGIGRAGIAAAALLPLALLVPLLVDTTLYATVYHGQRPAWRDARDLATSLREHKRGVVVGAVSGWPSLVFYLRPNHWRDPSFDPHPGVRVDRLLLETPYVSLTAFLDSARGQEALLVLTETELDAMHADPLAEQLLARSFRTMEVLASAFHGGADTLHVLRRTTG